MVYSKRGIIYKNNNMENKDEILRKFDETIQYFIDCSENLPGTDFSKNVDKLIDIKCDIMKGVEQIDDNFNISLVGNNEVEVCKGCAHWFNGKKLNICKRCFGNSHFVEQTEQR